MNESLIEKHFQIILGEGLGLDMTDPNLKDTPKRIARSYCKEFFSGLDPSNIPAITVFPNEDKYNEIIMLDNIPFTSMCSHHLLPFQGLAWFLYIPKDRLIGASKISRIISYFSARPQLQERLTDQIIKFFIDKIDPQGAMLVMRATHGCMTCRGIKQGINGGMVTSSVYGSFKELISTRNEGLELIKLSRR